MTSNKNSFFYFYRKEQSIYFAAGNKFKTKLFRVPRRAIASLFGKRKTHTLLDFSAIRSILIRPGGGIGDAVVLTATLAQLKQAYPNLCLGVLATPRAENVFINNPLVDKLLPDTFSTYLNQRDRWDVFIDYLPFFSERNILCDALLKPRYIIALQKNPADYYFSRQFKNYDYYCPFNLAHSLAACLQQTPLSPHLPPLRPRYRVPVDPKAAIYADLLWQTNKTRVLLNCSGTFRHLDTSDFRKLIQQLVSQFANKADFLLLNTAQNQPFADIEGVRRAPFLNGPEFIACCASSDILITPDTSLVHLAGAFDKRLIAFYADTPDKGLWQPLNAQLQRAFILPGAASPLAIAPDTQQAVLDNFRQFILQLSPK